MKKILGVVGARPNFMKIDPIYRAFEKYSYKYSFYLVHTGQHYDKKMSDIFFRDLGLKKPDIYLGIGSGTHAEQTAKVMLALEKILIEKKPDLVIVVGDVNSTFAAALTAVKLNIPVAHVEAGLRSFDWSMPEEINRILTDRISQLLFTPSQDANENLKREGISEDKIFFVGNVMIDTLNRLLPAANKSDILKKLNLYPQKYVLLTLHRPSNVDDYNSLKEIVESIIEIQKELTIVFPMHPRTKKNLNRFGFYEMLKTTKNIILLEPLGYIDFLALEKNAKVVLTDSGGVQEETTFLGVPCLTLRENTERPITVKLGTNTLVGTNKEKILYEFYKILKSKEIKKYKIPPLWDGKAAERIVKVVKSAL